MARFRLGFQISLDSTYGGLLIAVMVSNILLGVTCLQVYYYFRRYTDSAFIRWQVTTLLLLELLHGIFSMHAIYYYLVLDFLSPFSLIRSVWSLTAMILMKILIILLVQSSYAFRIYYVSGRKYLIPGILMALILCALALGTVLLVSLFENPLVASETGTPDHFAAVMFIIDAVMNFIVVSALGYYLSKGRSGINQTEKIIDRLIMHIVNNGLLIGIIEITAVVMLLRDPDNLYSLGISQVLGNLYANSWMATLNSREHGTRSYNVQSSILVFTSQVSSATEVPVLVPSVDKESLPRSLLE